MEPRCEAIWLTVSLIPRGRVATYGGVAMAAGLAGRARLVGQALSRLPGDSRVPWHRVVNARGSLSFPLDSADWQRQADRLRDEGVILENGRIRDFRSLCWPH